MQNPSRDLWPEDIGIAADLITPVAILKEQATFLGQRTQNLIEGKVSTESSGQLFHHAFFLVAPALKNYRYLLLKVSHTISLYPVEIYVEPLNKIFRADSQKEFIDELVSIFSDEKVKKVIQGLLAQSQA